MNQAAGRTPLPQAAQSIGWPVPWWGLIAGGGFVALMASPFGVMPGFAMIWMIIFMVVPFMIIGGIVGGSAAGYVAGALAVAAYVLAPVVVSVHAILKAPDRRVRARRLNGLVLFLLLLTGVAMSIRTFGAAWPY